MLCIDMQNVGPLTLSTETVATLEAGNGAGTFVRGGVTSITRGRLSACLLETFFMQI